MFVTLKSSKNNFEYSEDLNSLHKSTLFNDIDLFAIIFTESFEI